MSVSRRLRALIVDDEPAARRLLATLLADEPEVEVAGTCTHGTEAVAWLRANSADLVFLDVRMPGLDGFGVLESLAHPPPAVVFVTAYDEFAIRAFEFEAWDYLLKPFDAERLGQTLGRVRRRLDRESPGRLGDDLAPLLERLAEPQRPLERLAVPHGRGRVTIRLADVVLIQAESNYVRFHLAAASYLARISLRDLESRLDEGRFVRVHRSAIVNADRITRLEPCGHGDLRLRLDDGRELTLSRRYRDRLERVLESLP